MNSYCTYQRSVWEKLRHTLQLSVSYFNGFNAFSFWNQLSQFSFHVQWIIVYIYWIYRIIPLIVLTVVLFSFLLITFYQSPTRKNLLLCAISYFAYAVYLVTLHLHHVMHNTTPLTLSERERSILTAVTLLQMGIAFALVAVAVVLLVFLPLENNPELPASSAAVPNPTTIRQADLPKALCSQHSTLDKDVSIMVSETRSRNSECHSSADNRQFDVKYASVQPDQKTKLQSLVTVVVSPAPCATSVAARQTPAPCFTDTVLPHYLDLPLQTTYVTSSHSETTEHFTVFEESGQPSPRSASLRSTPRALTMQALMAPPWPHRQLQLDNLDLKDKATCRFPKAHLHRSPCPWLNKLPHCNQTESTRVGTTSLL